MVGSDGFLDNVRLKQEILWHIEQGRYRFTRHAMEEHGKDELDLRDTVHVLKTGSHDQSKTSFDNKFQVWNYAIIGKTESLKTVRVIIAFVDEMIVVTVIKIKSRL